MSWTRAAAVRPPARSPRTRVVVPSPPARVLAFLPSPGASPRGVPSRSPSPLPPVPTADLPGDGPRARGVRLPRGAQRLPRPRPGPDPGGRPRRPDPREHGRGRRPPRARRGRRRPPLLPPAGGDGDARARFEREVDRRGGRPTAPAPPAPPAAPLGRGRGRGSASSAPLLLRRGGRLRRRAIRRRVRVVPRILLRRVTRSRGGADARRAFPRVPARVSPRRVV